MCDDNQKRELLDPFLALIFSLFSLGITPKDIEDRLEEKEEYDDEPGKSNEHQLVDAK